MKSKRVVAKRGNDVLGAEITLADSFWSRLKGLINKRELPMGAGVLLTPCRQIHTFMMRISIDVLFLNSQGEIIELITALPPNRISPAVQGACHVLELPCGAIELFSLQKNFVVNFFAADSNRQVLPERQDIIASR